MTLPKRFHYSWRALGGDIAGGVVAALIALPYGLAMSALMGLPPVYGLLTSLITAPVTFALGRNPVLIGGTSTVTVPFVAQAVADHGMAGAAKITLVASVFLLAFSVLKLGRYIARVPGAVVSGFSCGIGAMMVISQLRTLLGLPSAGPAGASPAAFQLWSVVQNMAAFHWTPLLLGGITVSGAFLAARLDSRLPAPLLSVTAASALSWFFSLHEKEVGKLPLALPDFARFTWSAGDIDKVLLPGLGLAVVMSINLLLTSRVVEHFSGKHRKLAGRAADAELGAYGIANVCAGIFGVPPSVGIPARSLANVRCGATTRWSNLVHVFVLLGCLMLGAGVVARIPLAALAGVTAYVGICLLEWSAWRRLFRMRLTDRAAFLTAVAGVLVTNAALAVLLACAWYAVPALRSRIAEGGLGGRTQRATWA